MKVRDSLDLSQYDLEGSLEEVIKTLQHKLETYSKTYTNLTISLNIHGAYGDDYIVADLHGERDETETERTARERTERNRLKLQENEERRQLAKLKEKYEQRG